MMERIVQIMLPQIFQQIVRSATMMVRGLHQPLTMMINIFPFIVANTRVNGTNVVIATPTQMIIQPLVVLIATSMMIP